jgi:Rps23 Pro-64 3,4-dihydroxylase Tpa1-like proline 4-hydroxylase
LSIDAISDIQEIETQAEEIRKDTRKIAREKAEALRMEATQKAETMIGDKRKQLTQLSTEAEALVKAKIQVLNQENKTKCDAICMSAEAKLAEAQTFILERTVKHYGSR